jgi:hypothetical protein
VVFEHYDFPDLKTDAIGVATFATSKMAWFKDSGATSWRSSRACDWGAVQIPEL